MHVADYVTIDTGTGLVHSAPAHGVEDFQTCRAHGMKDDKIINVVMGNGQYVSTPSHWLFKPGKACRHTCGMIPSATTTRSNGVAKSFW